MVTADVVGLYPSIPHEVGLRALREALDKRAKIIIPAEELSDLETKFLEGQHLQPLVWLWYIHDIFFIWTYGEETLKNLTVLTNT